MTRRKTTTEFIEEARRVHGDRYDYSKVNYITSKEKIELICPIHGSVFQLPFDHLSGHACPKCGRHQKTTDQYIGEARLVHGSRYDYSRLVYLGSEQEIEVICLEHGSFFKLPWFHLQGQGCPICTFEYDYRRKPLATFIDQAILVHGARYDYSLVKYKNNYKKIDIICDLHGVFQQSPINHLRGRGCQKCGDQFGVKEGNWLNSIGISDDQQHRQVRIYFYDGSYIRADGYDDQTKTIFEFWGDGPHGNPIIHNPTDIYWINKRPYGELYQKTQDKIRRIKEAGYNLIDIWEHDWDKIQKLIDRHRANNY